MSQRSNNNSQHSQQQRQIKELQTPLRQSNLSQNSSNNNEFQSSQKQKYDKSMNQSGLVQTLNLPHLQSGDGFLQAKEIYENQIPMKLKTQDREDQETYLTLKIALCPGNNSHGQILQLELTDEGNQFGCLFEVKGSEAWLRVTEQNHFKILVHLSLKFRAATDDILKGYLAAKLTKEKISNEDLRISNSRLEESLAEEQAKNDDLKSQLDKIQQERESSLETLTLDHQKKMHLQKEESLQKESELRRQLEQKQQTTSEKYEMQIKQLTEQNEQLRQNNSELSESKMTLDSQLREMTTKSKISDREITAANQELQKIQCDNKNLDSVRFAQERKITELTFKLESIERSLGDKESLISSSKILASSADEQKRLLEREIAEKNEAIGKLEKKLDLCREEIEKGNDVIDKLRDGLDKKKKKLKLKDAMILQQEQNIQHLQQTVDSSNKQINDLQRERDTSDLKLKEALSDNSDLKSKLSDSQKVIEQNHSMIQYLNGHLNSNNPSANSISQRPPISTLGGQQFGLSSTYANSKQTSQLQPTFNPNKYTSYTNNHHQDKYEIGARSHTPLQNTHKPSYSYSNTYQLANSSAGKSFQTQDESQIQQDKAPIGRYLLPSSSTLKDRTQTNTSFTKYSQPLQEESTIAPIKYRDPTKS